MIAIAVLLTAFVLAALFLGAAAVVHLARLQAAVMKHRSEPWRTENTDEELYRAAGFERLPSSVQRRLGPDRWKRGDEIR
jgi:hypothetical protein